MQVTSSRPSQCFQARSLTHGSPTCKLRGTQKRVGNTLLRAKQEVSSGRNLATSLIGGLSPSIINGEGRQPEPRDKCDGGREVMGTIDTARARRNMHRLRSPLVYTHYKDAKEIGRCKSPPTLPRSGCSHPGALWWAGCTPVSERKKAERKKGKTKALRSGDLVGVKNTRVVTHPHFPTPTHTGYRWLRSGLGSCLYLQPFLSAGASHSSLTPYRAMGVAHCGLLNIPGHTTKSALHRAPNPCCC